MTTGFPVSPLTPATFLLVGLAGIELGRASALHRAVAVRGVAADGRGCVALRSVPAVRTRSASAAAPATPAIGSSRRWSWPRRASSTTWCSSASPSAPSRWRSSARRSDPRGRLRSAARRADARRCCRPAPTNGVTIVTNMGAANPRPRRPRSRDSRASWASRPAGRGRDRRRRARRGHRAAASRSPRPASRSRRSATRWCRPTPTSAPSRSSRRWRRAPTSSSPAAPPIRRCSSRRSGHAFGWAADDWALLGRGTAVGHLLECAGQVTGGYFADPGRKDVAGLARLGFPIAEVAADGRAVITKVPGLGRRGHRRDLQGAAALRDHDPGRLHHARRRRRLLAASGWRADGANRVRVDGATGRPAPPTLKVALGYRDGFIGEGQISYAGSGAVARARLAGAIVEERLRLIGVRPDAVRCDLIGVDALHGAAWSRAARRSPTKCGCASRRGRGRRAEADAHRPRGRGALHQRAVRRRRRHRERPARSWPSRRPTCRATAWPAASSVEVA